MSDIENILAKGREQAVIKAVDEVAEEEGIKPQIVGWQPGSTVPLRVVYSFACTVVFTSESTRSGLAHSLLILNVVGLLKLITNLVYHTSGMLRMKSSIGCLFLQYLISNG